MEIVEVNTSKPYPVYIGEGASQLLPKIIEEYVEDCSIILIVTDSNVAPLFLKSIQSLLHEFPVNEWVIPAGESSKTLREYEKMITHALRSGLDRHALIIALGGSVVGDLAGFLASTFLRGIRLIQVPTTLLAHDSSVGGKVGINHALGKNLIGAFYQPEAVVCDFTFLTSLTQKEWRSGFAEIVKLALILDPSFLVELQMHVSSLPIEHEKLRFLVQKAVKMKAAIVALDEWEASSRTCLNFGHTLGHAIELESRYQHISHGEAVMIGMLFAIKLSERLYQKKLLSAELLGWIAKLGYSFWHPTLRKKGLLLEQMKKDKKSVTNSIRMVLLDGIGKARVAEIPEKVVIQALTDYQKWVASLHA